VDRLAGNPQSADLTPADHAMIEFALALTRAPGDLSAGAVTPLRDVGFDDRAIHDICAVTAYFAFVNRLADGLGVELEERFGPP
jgi:uncharacterized peroxidase-related enzyme